MLSQDVVVAVVQTGAGGAGASTVDHILETVGRVDLAVLPELFHLPYFPVGPDDERPNAVPVPGRLVHEMQDVASRRACCLVVPLYLYEQDRTACHNACIVIDRDGSIAVGRTLDGRSTTTYAKVHLCDVDHYGSTFQESRHFRPGSDFVVWDLPFGRIGVLICYDRHFPEAWRSLRAGGVGVVCVATASPASVGETFVPEMQAMALQQGVFVAAAGRAGHERLASGVETSYLGQSCVIGPDGHVLGVAATGFPDVAVTARCHRAQLSEIRRGLPLSSHRRPDAYRLDEPGGVHA